MKYDSIQPGKVRLDTDGKPIQAHGFSVFYRDGLYYWYGENKEKSKKAARSGIGVCGCIPCVIFTTGTTGG